VRLAAFFLGLICCGGVYLDAFQTIILPRRPTGRLRITRLFYIVTWTPWAWAARRVKAKGVREQVYSVFGPLSLLLLLVVWAVLLVVGFAGFYYSMKTPFNDSAGMSSTNAPFRTDLYVSGTTLFTLGLGDVVPRSMVARALVIFEAGTGLGFVALVIGYVPVLYQAFSRREVDIALLDARAGSPPTSGEMLRRHQFTGGDDALIVLLTEWERWSAEMLETHVSYPILCYYRSQHDNQSWLSAMTAVLDACALLIAVVKGPASRQAQLTFAMARHALIDLGHVFHLEKQAKEWVLRGDTGRLAEDRFGALCDVLADAGFQLCGDKDSSLRLHAMRTLYEPHACAIAEYLGMTLPGWVPEPNAKDQWVVIERLRVQAEAALAENRLADGPDVERLVGETHEH
jgi:hypothetical protein